MFLAKNSHPHLWFWWFFRRVLPFDDPLNAWLVFPVKKTQGGPKSSGWGHEDPANFATSTLLHCLSCHPPCFLSSRPTWFDTVQLDKCRQNVFYRSLLCFRSTWSCCQLKQSLASSSTSKVNRPSPRKSKFAISVEPFIKKKKKCWDRDKIRVDLQAHKFMALPSLDQVPWSGSVPPPCLKDTNILILGGIGRVEQNSYILILPLTLDPPQLSRSYESSEGSFFQAFWLDLYL